MIILATIFKILLAVIGFIVLVTILHVVDYWGHWIAWRSFGDTHFDHCTRRDRCPVVHLKGTRT